MPFRGNKRYTSFERYILDLFAASCADKDYMYANAHVISRMLNRSFCAICKQVELRNKWFWAA